MVLLYWGFGRNRDYLALGVLSGFLCVSSAARAVQYLTDSIETGLLMGNIYMIALPLAAGIALWVGIERSNLRAATSRLLKVLVAAEAATMFAAAASGRVLDPSYRYVKTVSVGFVVGQFHEFGLTGVGYALVLISVVFATVAGLLLARAARDDRVARNFFLTAAFVVNLASAHDLLLMANFINSVYIVEHSLFFLAACVLAGFLRGYEISRKELQASSRRLQRTAQRLDKASDETRRLRSMADLGRLSASLAHEIRNPVAVLTNVASRLRSYSTRQRSAEEHDSLVEMLQEETDRLARVVDDLLLFTRTGRGARETLEAAFLVEMAVSDVKRLMDGDDTTAIVTNITAGLPSLQGNADDLRRALVNLITNAVQSSGGEGQVKVVATQSANRPRMVLIGVEDEAGGVPEEAVEDIFEPFFSTRSSGTGLGLSIAKSIVEAHDGSLVLENRPGSGAGFWIRLPSFRSPELETWP